MMKNHMLNNRLYFVRLALVAIGAILSLPGAAQMQIPNPLLQPRKPVAQKEDVREPLPPMSAQQGGPRGMQEMGFPSQMGSAGNSANQFNSSKTLFAEVRERLAPLYVSAIVGDRAILRRGAVHPVGNAGPIGPIPLSMPGIAGMSPAAAASSVQRPTSGQSETMTVTDGEPIDFIGDGITLTPKITSNRVSIYYSEDGTAPKKGAKRQVVFIGQVESTAAGVSSPIVLEKPDPTYKQKVSVETKSRSSNGSGQAQGSSSIGNQPQSNLIQ